MAGGEEKSDRQKLIKWLDGKWRRPPECPICGSAQWTAGEVIELRQYNGGGLIIGGPGGAVYPMSQLICNTCGYTHLFNAILAGVVPRDDRPVEQ